VRISLNAQKLSFAQAYHSGGISRYAYELLCNLRQLESRHHFTVYAPEPTADPALATGASFRLVRAGAPADRALQRILWEQLILPLRMAGQADLHHGLAFALPLVWPGRSVVTIFDLSFLRFPRMFNRGNRAYLALSTRLAARRAERIITISEHCRREVIELLGVPPGRVVTTLCAADTRFRPLPPAEVEAFRQRRRLPQRFILYLGTLEPRKNVAALVRAYARLRATRPDSPALVLAGARGWMFEEVFRTIERLGLEQQVILPGFIPSQEQPLWYNAATVFAYPSFYEGFGLPPLEAMACGTPVVVSNATSLPEVVGQAGWLVDPKDEAALTAALESVLTDPDLAASLRQAGLRQAARFSWSRLARETLSVYDDLDGKV
jgi:glycosyltransferase involved in cell wall biosynthesis